jgi:hypothetical protein
VTPPTRLGISPEQSPLPTIARVVGRVSADVLCDLADSGWSTTLRVPPDLASEFGVCERARLILGVDGSPDALAPIAA